MSAPGGGHVAGGSDHQSAVQLARGGKGLQAFGLATQPLQDRAEMKVSVALGLLEEAPSGIVQADC
jgi:hypothetical protein